VWSVAVVVNAPGFDRRLCFCKRVEPLRVQALLPNSTVEGFGECILYWFARLNEVELYVVGELALPDVFVHGRPPLGWRALGSEG
jgi:hypothetical protein